MKKHIILFQFVIFCIVFSSCTPAINRKIEKSEIFDSSFTGLSVYHIKKKKFLYNYNANKYFTPASTIKLLTFYAGLKILGDSIPGLTYRSIGDSLIFKATGDPSFLNSRWNNSKVLQFLKNSHKDLYYLKSNYIPDKFGPGWAWDDYNYSFSAERSVFPIYGNTVRFNFHKNKLKSWPKLFLASTKIQNKNAIDIAISRNIDRNEFLFNKQGNKNFERKIPFRTSEELSIQLLKDTLQKNISILISLPATKRPENILYSMPSDSLYQEMLVQSDNFIAEQILMMVGQKLSDSLKSKNAIEYLLQNNLNNLNDTIYWVDGSGLSRYNLVTPKSMVEIFKKIHHIKGFKALRQMLPNGGVSGTLKNYFGAEEVYVIAKTGSLRNNFSLTGYLISQKNDLLIFSFMNANYTASSHNLKTEMEKIFQLIRKRY